MDPARVELHIKVRKGMKVDRAFMERITREWASGVTPPDGIKFELVTWDIGNGKRKGKQTSAALTAFQRERLGRLVQGSKISFRKVRKD